MPNAVLSRKHLWALAAEVPLDDDHLHGAVYARDKGKKVQELLDDVAPMDVLDVYCTQCRRTYTAGMATDCPVFDTGTDHLRGGTPGHRRARICPDHHVKWDQCEQRHTFPANFGRPPIKIPKQGPRGR